MPDGAGVTKRTSARAGTMQGGKRQRAQNTTSLGTGWAVAAHRQGAAGGSSGRGRRLASGRPSA
eukprot:6728754-Lingulodinium_polyedra.AAC.1